MKAFVRRYGTTAVADARGEANTDLAAAWERMHANAAEAFGPSTATATATATAADFDRAYAAYVRHVETTTSVSATTTSPRSTTTAAATTTPPQLRRADRMAVAWESSNRRRVCARRFADRFAATDVAVAASEELQVAEEEEKGGKGGAAAEAATTNNSMSIDRSTTTSNAAAVAAVVALVVAPMLLGRASQMCDCELGDVISGAVDWVSFNEDAFEREFQKMEGDIWQQGGKVLEGCECLERDGSVPSRSCTRLVACPALTRRYLKASEPACNDCNEVDGFLGGDLFDLFS